MKTRFPFSFSIVQTSIFIPLLICSITSSVYAQWARTSGPSGGQISGVGINGTTLFAGVSGAELYRSTNSGTNWAPQTSNQLLNNITGFGFDGTTIYACGNSGIFRSTDNGVTWTTLKQIFGSYPPISFANRGSNLYAGTSGNGVFASADSGKTWQAANTGISTSVVNVIAVNSTDVFIGTRNGLFRSTNNGSSWTEIDSGITNIFISSLCLRGTELFAGTYGDGAYRSTDNGAHWKPINSGLTTNAPFSLVVSGTTLLAAGSTNGVFTLKAIDTTWALADSGLMGADVLNLAAGGGNVLAGTRGGGVFLSTDNGTSWKGVNSGIRNSQVNTLMLSGTNLFAGTGGSGISRSSDNGTTWTVVNSGLTNYDVRCFAVNGANLFAGTNNGVFLSTNNGTSWTVVNTGLTYTGIRTLAASGSILFAGTGGGAFRSTNSGSTWTAVGLSNTDIRSLVMSGTKLFAGTYGKGVFFSPDSGATWIAANSGLSNKNVTSLVVLGTNIFAGTYQGGIFVSPIADTTWKSANTGQTSFGILCFAASGTNIFAGTYGGIFLSSNNGSNWTDVRSNLADPTVMSVVASGTQLFVGSSNQGVCRRPLSEMITVVPALQNLVQVAGGTFTAGTTPVTISRFNIEKYEVTYELWTEVRNWALTNGYASTDLSPGRNGYNPVGTNHPVTEVMWYDAVKWCNARSEKEGLIPVYYTSAAQTTVYRSGQLNIDSGAVKWTADGFRLPTEAEWEFAARGGKNSKGFTYSGSNSLDSVAWYDVNSGTASHAVGTKGANELGIYDMSGNVAEWCWDWWSSAYPSLGTTDPKGPATTQSFRILRGGSFFQFNTYDRVADRGSNNPTAKDYIDGFRCAQSYVVKTGIENRDQHIPVSFSLSQNYPNPFNPSTVIRYGLPTRSRVTLEIFDMLGRRVATLVNEEQEARYYERTWQANVSSGLYFYRLEAVSSEGPTRSFVQVRKMLMLK